MDLQAPTELESTPVATKVALVGVLLSATAAVALSADGAVLVLLTALFALRVAGQVLVLVRHPSWLPPMHAWNFVPYRILLPLQLLLLAVMCAICAGARPPALAAIAVPASFVYAGAMAVRYTRRMQRRPGQRWFGGTIPIVFHGVLAAFLFALGTGNA